MTQTILIDDLKCDCRANSGGKVVYMLYPDAGNYFPAQWIDDLAVRYGIAIVMVYIPLDRWNDCLTPWPEPGEAPGFPPFAGLAGEFLDKLVGKVVPQCELAMKITSKPVRHLVGVSLSGLFTLWQWVQCDVFSSIACLSGSFWYPGFVEWFDKQPVPQRSGKAYFLLGKKEPHAAVRAYRSVGVDTEAVVKRLADAGIDVHFDWVPGAHIDNPLPRAEKALQYLEGQNL